MNKKNLSFTIFLFNFLVALHIPSLSQAMACTEANAAKKPLEIVAKDIDKCVTKDNPNWIRVATTRLCQNQNSSDCKKIHAKYHQIDLEKDQSKEQYLENCLNKCRLVKKTIVNDIDKCKSKCREKVEENNSANSFINCSENRAKSDEIHVIEAKLKQCATAQHPKWVEAVWEKHCKNQVLNKKVCTTLKPVLNRMKILSKK